MEKAKLKEVLSRLNPGDVIEVEFTGEKASQSGEYKVLTSKVGRGKCGSRIASLESTSSGETVSIGTAQNSEILSLTVAGEKILSGENTLATYSRDLDKAKVLKEKLSGLVGFGGRQVRITSASEPTFNGLFTLDSAELLKGRYGQIKAKMTNDSTGQSIEIWSYRHSGVVDEIEIVE